MRRFVVFCSYFSCLLMMRDDADRLESFSGFTSPNRNGGRRETPLVVPMLIAISIKLCPRYVLSRGRMQAGVSVSIYFAHWHSRDQLDLLINGPYDRMLGQYVQCTIRTRHC